MFASFISAVLQTYLGLSLGLRWRKREKGQDRERDLLEERRQGGVVGET